jgi:nitroreductase/dihydropteridine reductase
MHLDINMTQLHPVLKDLNARYTTKRFDPSKKVSQADIDVILEAARLSVSSINAQPWKFVMLGSDQAKQRFNNTYVDQFLFNQPHALSASHTLLIAHNPAYKRENYQAVVDQGVSDGRIKPEDVDANMGAFAFVDINTDEQGNNEAWTKAQTYIALGNILHTLARLNIDSTTMEGIDSARVNKEFAAELDGHVCHVAIAIGYRDESQDYNAKLPKSRLKADDVVVAI